MVCFILMHRKLITKITTINDVIIGDWYDINNSHVNQSVLNQSNRKVW